MPALDAILALGRAVSASAFQPVIDSLYTSSLILYLDIAFRAALSTGFVLVCRRYLDRRPLCSLGFVRPGGRPASSVPLGLFIGIFPIVLVASILLAAGELMFVKAESTWPPLFMIPLLAVAAFYEEIVYRGYLFQNFLDAQKPILGVIVSSLLFWLMHGFNNQVWSSPLISVNLIIGGVELALAYQLSGNIWFPTALHMGWNYTQGGVLGLPISGERITGWMRLAPGPESSRFLTGGAFGLEGSILMTVCEIGVILVFLLLLRKRKGQLYHKLSGENP